MLNHQPEHDFMGHITSENGPRSKIKDQHELEHIQQRQTYNKLV